MCFLIMAHLDPTLEYLEYYFDSSDATLTTDVNVSKLNWPLFNLVTPLQNVQSFKILSAQIPISYCVSAGARITIKMFSANQASFVFQQVTLPTTGTPSGAILASYISGILAANPPNLTGWLDAGVQTYLVCTFVPAAQSTTGLPYFSFDTNTFSYGSNSNSNQDFEISVTNQRTEDVMGFPIGITQCTNFGVIGSGINVRKYKTSPRPTLISGSPYLYISSNAIGNNCKTFLPQGAALLSSGVSSPQMAKVAVSDAVQGQWLTYNDDTTGWFDVDGIGSISQIDFYCQLGNYGGYIDFQGLPFSIRMAVLVQRDTKSDPQGLGSSTVIQPFAQYRWK
jgi:hypothetical protein